MTSPLIRKNRTIKGLAWFIIAFIVLMKAMLLVAILTPPAKAQNVATYIPPRATQYLPLVYEESERYMPELAQHWYFGALIEHESCISLTHSRCWSPTSELKTAREQGVGFGQITRAYTTTGAIRFDTLTDLTNRFKQDLYGLSWNTIKTRPDLQIRAMILLWRDNWKQLYMVDGAVNRIRMADSAYNGGLSSVKTSRQKCGLAADCNPQWWFDNVEKFHKLNQTAKIYGNRSARDINLHHVQDVTVTRWGKYEKHYKENVAARPPSVAPAPQ